MKKSEKFRQAKAARKAARAAQAAREVQLRSQNNVWRCPGSSPDPFPLFGLAGLPLLTALSLARSSDEPGK